MEIETNNQNNEVKSYIQKDYIVIELELDSEKYSKNFTLERLRAIDRYFYMSRNLEEALKDLKDLFKTAYTIEKKEKYINVVINYRDSKINFELDKFDDNINISYDNLSDRMKEIIDKDELILGIDLGTTYSCAAIMIDKNIVMIRNSLGSTTTPSYVSFLDKNKVYVGELAKLLPSETKNIIYNTKRLLGKSIEDEDIKDLIKKLPFSVKKEQYYNLLKIVIDFGSSNNNEIHINNDEEFYPEQICALLLKKIVKDSEFYLTKKIGKEIKIKNAVITVPAYFNQKQRESTANSAKIIGLNLKTMINEPTAASLAYAFRSLENTDKNIIVIDFGGGTLDITLLRYKKDKDAIYCDVKFTYGNTNFGGEDFDNIIMEKCLKEFKMSEIKSEKEIATVDYLRLKRACERAKIKLSSFDSTKIHIEDNNYKSNIFHLTKDKFIQYCRPLFIKLSDILNHFIKESKINKIDISEIILIGGSTLIPKVREIIKSVFDHPKLKIHYDLDPKEVVAMGAAIRGAKESQLPSVEEIKLFDVTNLSLGIKIINNNFAEIIPRSTSIPCHREDIFITCHDNQTEALIEVYEGEKKDCCDKNNLLLGKFTIAGLPKRKKGEVKVEVKIEIEENSILKITATDISNKSNKKDLIIEKYNNFLETLNDLIERDERISLFENINYNEIKFSLIECEEDLRKQKSKKQINNNIKFAYKKIIEIIGTFLVNSNVLTDLYISLIKYYFSKLCDFYIICNIDDDKEELKNIKEDIAIIFDKIQFNDRRDVIFEIIEESIDEDNIYKSFIDFIMQSLWEDINMIFYTTKINDSNNYKKVLSQLSQAKSLINICTDLINIYDPEKYKINNISSKDIKNIQLKIEIREAIIEKKSRYFIQKIFSSDQKQLRNLLHQYSQNPDLKPQDLDELKSFIEEIESNNESFEVRFEKARKFSEWLKQQKKENDIYRVIYEILSSYPYVKSEEDNIWKEFNEFKSHKLNKDDYLLMLRAKYQIRDDMDDIEKNVYKAISEYLNMIAN